MSMMRNMALALTMMTWAAPGMAQDARITADMAQAGFSLNGMTHTIGRIQDQANVLSGDYARTSRACPPDCIQPIIAAPGVETYGELEVINFLTGQVAAGRGLLIDSRDPTLSAAGTLPSAINIPVVTLAQSNPYRLEILKALGVIEVNGDLDFTEAYALLLFSDGPWSDQAALAARELVKSGYPAEKIKYYRGGMQAWLALGLTIQTP